MCSTASKNHMIQMYIMTPILIPLFIRKFFKNLGDCLEKNIEKFIDFKKGSFFVVRLVPYIQIWPLYYLYV